MATSRSASAAARLSRAAAAALRASGNGQSIRSDLSRALIAANENKISSAPFTTSSFNRFSFNSALARSYSTAAATGQIPGVKSVKKMERSAGPATVLNLPNRILWHVNEGIEEILADYVHQEITRNWILICFRLFLLIIMKDVFVSLTDL